MNVFILEPVKQDLSAAMKYGTLCYIFGYDDTRSSIWDEQFPEEILQRLDLAKFDPTHDMLLIVGNMIPLTVMTAAVVAKYTAVNVLLWNATDRDYVVRRIGACEYVRPSEIPVH